MDGNRFDDLTKTLASGVSRRGVVRGALGGIAGAALAALRVETAGAKPKGGPNDECKVGCSGFNRQAKRACERACRECGGDIDRVCADEGPFGPTAFVCCPPGTFCVGEGVCCEEGTEPCFGPEGVVCCEPGTFCNFETGACDPPAVCGPESGCLGGPCAIDCFCVSSVEGDGACVSGFFADCNATPCETSADCGEGGVCVDVTSEFCCAGDPSPRICFPAEAICATDGAGATTTRTTAPAWRR